MNNLGLITTKGITTKKVLIGAGIVVAIILVGYFVFQDSKSGIEKKDTTDI